MDIDTLFLLVCIGHAAVFLAAVSAIMAIIGFAVYGTLTDEGQAPTTLLKISIAFAILSTLSAAVAAGMPSMHNVKAYLSIKNEDKPTATHD